MRNEEPVRSAERARQTAPKRMGQGGGWIGGLVLGVASVVGILAAGESKTSGEGTDAKSAAKTAVKFVGTPSEGAVKESLEGWLKTQNASEEQKKRIEQIWGAGGRSRLDRIILAMGMVKADVEQLQQGALRGDFPRDLYRKLVAEDRHAFWQSHLRLFAGKQLAMEGFFDEALAELGTLTHEQVSEPATLLFYKGMCQYSLLHRAAAADALDLLLNHTEDVPERYRVVAAQMQRQLPDLKEKSLKEVAHQMTDVKRRLGLGQTGEPTQEVEKKIVATLDELIEKTEDELKKKGGGGGSSGNKKRRGQSQAENPAAQPYLDGVKGKGEVDDKDMKYTRGWGNLPEKVQAKAQSLITRQFPTHYRRAVEEYLKKLAQRPAPGQPNP